MRLTPMHNRGLLAAVTLHVAALLAAVGGCTPRPGAGLTDAGGTRSIQRRQSSPTQIQALVMAFGDKYAARSADVLDRVHDDADAIEVRRYAREAKVAAGWAAVTIATEVNPVAAMLDMVAMVRLKRRSFDDHGAATLPPDAAERVRALHEQSEREAWDMVCRFLTQEQADQLRDAIDRWYEQNQEMRSAAHLRLLEFANFRRESVLDARSTPANVLALLALDPLARMDPVQRELNESRLLAERVGFFAKRMPPLLFWQVQLATADLISTPEAQQLLRQSEQVTASTGRFVASTEQFAQACERFVTAWEALPEATDQVLRGSIAQLRESVAEERKLAIDGLSAAASVQREALLRDATAVEASTRRVIADLNQTLAEARKVAADVSASAEATVDAASRGATRVLDHGFRLTLALFLTVLLTTPAVLLVFRYASDRPLHARYRALRRRVRPDRRQQTPNTVATRPAEVAMGAAYHRDAPVRPSQPQRPTPEKES